MLVLTDQDLVELQMIVNECRHKDAVAIIAFVQSKQKAALPVHQSAPAPSSTPTASEPPQVNGHDEHASA